MFRLQAKPQSLARNPVIPSAARDLLFALESGCASEEDNLPSLLSVFIRVYSCLFVFIRVHSWLRLFSAALSFQLIGVHPRASAAYYAFRQ
jgi:hypothetical protein